MHNVRFDLPVIGFNDLFHIVIAMFISKGVCAVSF